MDDLAVRFADLLESIAARVRSVTVDRIDRGTRIVSLGIVTATLAFVAQILLAIGIFRVIAELIGVIPAYFLVGGLLILAGALIWARRKPAEKSSV